MGNQVQKSLLPQHRKLLKDSGISDEIIHDRGYYSETAKANLGRLGFSINQRNVPTLMLPAWTLDGRISFHQSRPDHPRTSRGKRVKYEAPLGSTIVIDVPPSVRKNLLDGAEPLFITEGIRKADAAASHKLTCIALLGVYGWKEKEDFWRSIPLDQRVVYIVFDSDISTNFNVCRAAAGLFSLLESMGAKPHIITLPPNGSEKVGLDDYLVANGSPDGLYALAKAEHPSFQICEEDREIHKYESDENGIIKILQTKDGPVKHRITNFSARIISETVYTRSNEEIRELEIEAVVTGTKLLVMVSAEEFERMAWPIPRLGAGAIIYSGNGVKDETRAAIQLLSRDIRRFVGIEKLGWHKINGEHVFVHAGGVIRGKPSTGADFEEEKRPASNIQQGIELSATHSGGPICQTEAETLGIRMRVPPALKRYRLPTPSSGPQLKKDLRASMHLLVLASFPISIPIYSAIWYTSITDADFSIHLYGTTGGFKTEYVALAVQHFGPELDARHLPANWSSTTNYIRAISAHAGNVILPVDDFVPTGSQNDIERSYRAAEDVFRSQGNAAGRGRSNRNGTPQEPAPPKCLILSTGEVRPSGQSLTSRVLMLEVNSGDILNRDDEVKMKSFTLAQKLAKSGASARVMAAYIQWIASDYDYQLKTLNEQALTFRAIFSKNCQHARTVDEAAKLLAGFDRFLDFASAVGGIDDALYEGLWSLAHDALFEVLETQDQDQAEESPVNRFLELLRTALATGRAHLAYLLSPTEEGAAYGSPTYFGYQERTIMERKAVHESTDIPDKSLAGGQQGRDANDFVMEQKIIFTTQGHRIGWKKFDDLYFEPKESLAIVQRLAKDMNQPPIPMNHKALGKRLGERGLLASSRKDRNVARVNIDGRKEDVFHIRLDDFIELERNEGDFVDERNEIIFQEREQAQRRQEQSAKLRKSRRQQVDSSIQQQLMKLLNIDSKPETI